LLAELILTNWSTHPLALERSNAVIVLSSSSVNDLQPSPQREIFQENPYNPSALAMNAVGGHPLIDSLRKI
jgi:hypothetical protein